MCGNGAQVGLNESEDQRVIRGGAWNFLPELVRASTRNWFLAGLRSNLIGFRLAQDLEP